MAGDGKSGTGLRPAHQVDPAARAGAAEAEADKTRDMWRRNAAARAQVAEELARARDAAEAPARKEAARRMRATADKAAANALRSGANRHAPTPPLPPPATVPKIQRPIITEQVVLAQIKISTTGPEATINNFSDREKGELAASVSRTLDTEHRTRGLTPDLNMVSFVVSDTLGLRRKLGRALTESEIQTSIQISLDVRARPPNPGR